MALTPINNDVCAIHCGNEAAQLAIVNRSGADCRRRGVFLARQSSLSDATLRSSGQSVDGLSDGFIDRLAKKRLQKIRVVRVESLVVPKTTLRSLET